MNATKKAKPRTVKTSKQISRALTLRAAGYSLAAISLKTDISPATLTRHFSKLGAEKGTLSSEAVAEAKKQLLNDVSFIDSVKLNIAACISDDVAQFIALREAMSENLEALMQDKDCTAQYRSRALAAHATALRVSQQVIRAALQIDEQRFESEKLPELSISVLTNDNIESMRAEQEREGVELGMIEQDDVISTEQ